MMNMTHGTPAQAHAQLPNGASPMFAARQAQSAVNQATMQQLQGMLQIYMGNPQDPRIRVAMQNNPGLAHWFKRMAELKARR